MILIKRNYAHKQIFRTFAILVSFAISASFFISCTQEEGTWPDERVMYRVKESNSTLQELWSLSNLFAVAPDAMTAVKQKVFIEGRFEQPGETEVLALNGRNGALLWRSDEYEYSLVKLSATPFALFSGSTGNGTMRAHDLNTGGLIWVHPMPEARYIGGFNVVDDLIYVVSSSGYHLLKADTGEILETFSEPPTSTTLQTVVARSGLAIAAHEINVNYFWANAFTEDLFFIRSAGEVWAHDLQTGNPLWSIEDVISNIVATDSAVYLLTKDRRLLELEASTGEVTNIVQFEPQPTETSGWAFANAFYVAVDEKAGAIHVFLGDGAQLFAFELSDRTR